jgi:hypothetical protein
MKAVGELCIDRHGAGAVKEGTERVESAGLDHSRAHESDVLSAGNERNSTPAGLLVPFKDHSVCVRDTARSIAAWLVVLSGLGPVLWGQHPVGQVLTEKDIWNVFCNDFAVVIGPGPTDRSYMGGVAGLEAVNTAVKRVWGSQKVILTVGKGVAGPIVD